MKTGARDLSPNMAQRQTPLDASRRDGESVLEQSVLIQSRETGDVIPEGIETPRGNVKALPFAKSWVHFMAGG